MIVMKILRVRLLADIGHIIAKLERMSFVIILKLFLRHKLYYLLRLENNQTQEKYWQIKHKLLKYKRNTNTEL